MAQRLSDYLDTGEVDGNVTNAVKRQGGLEISDTTGLQTALDGKADTGHDHTLADITDAGTMAGIDDAPSDGNEYARKDGTWSIVQGGGGAPSGITTDWFAGDGTTTDFTTSQAFDQDTIQVVLNGIVLVPDTDYTTPNDTTVSFSVAPESGDNILCYMVTGTVGIGTVDWGNIEGTLSNQTDLQAVLDLKLEDAPSDGNQYARQDGAWAVVTGGGGGIPEAPEDGTLYGRKDAAWASAAEASHTHEIADVTGLQDALDGKLATDAQAADSALLTGLTPAGLPISTATQTALDTKTTGDNLGSTTTPLNIVTCTQAEYDGITPSDDTLYFII